jgi:hypothetical protein
MNNEEDNKPLVLPVFKKAGKMQLPAKSRDESGLCDHMTCTGLVNGSPACSREGEVHIERIEAEKIPVH